MKRSVNGRSRAERYVEDHSRMFVVIATNFVQTAYPQHGSMLVVVATNFVQTAYPQHRSIAARQHACVLVNGYGSQFTCSKGWRFPRPRKGRHKLTRSLLINPYSRQLPRTSTCKESQRRLILKYSHAFWFPGTKIL